MFSTMNVIQREHRLRTGGVHYFPAAKKVSSKCEAVMDAFGEVCRANIRSSFKVDIGSGVRRIVIGDCGCVRL
jgi:hypothetical protein